MEISENVWSCYIFNDFSYWKPKDELSLRPVKAHGLPVTYIRLMSQQQKLWRRLLLLIC